MGSSGINRVHGDARTRDRSFEMRARTSFESSSPASSPASFARGSRASRAMRRASSSRASSSSSSSSLFELVDASRRGVGVAPDDDARRDIERAIDALASTTRAKGDDARSNNAKSYARWELAYTTEKETLWLLGLKTRSKTRAFQTLREDAKTLSNEVVFNDGEVVFKVDAVVEESSRATMKFRFRGFVDVQGQVFDSHSPGWQWMVRKRVRGRRAARVEGFARRHADLRKSKVK